MKINVKSFEMRRSASFLEYVFGGCQINLNVAIDFTLSNEEAHKPYSLHYMGDKSRNQYMQAIRAVGDIL